MATKNIDRIIATCRRDSRCVSGSERRALCDEIDRLRAENAWLRGSIPPQTLAAAVRKTDGLAALIAILVATRRAGDRLGERVARRRLQRDYGIRLAFATEKPAPNQRTAEAPKG